MRPRITVYGSVNMDLVAYVGERPAAGETVYGTRFAQVPGGKGANQAIAAARAGGDVAFLGAVGDDAFGVELRSALVDSEVDTSALRTAAGPSGIAHIVVEGGGDNSIIIVPGANAAMGGLEGADRRLLDGSDVLLLQLELPMAGVLAAAREGRERGVRTVLTPAPAADLPDELLGAVDLIMPNQHEAAALTGAADPERAAQALLERVPAVLITLGAEGSLYAERHAAPVRAAAHPVRAVDTTAAGDTFCGAFAVATAEGRGPAESMAFAAAAAALSVQRPGASTSMPHRTEIDAGA
ncbi:ribokinase [Nocardiopsis coralliicola]